MKGPAKPPVVLTPGWTVVQRIAGDVDHGMQGVRDEDPGDHGQEGMSAGPGTGAVRGGNDEEPGGSE